jgi:hypothetical protein|tara:strand:+ start:193 stop:579 length:387 start_codon:yes stop_codon:yes gene_type:complete
MTKNLILPPVDFAAAIAKILEDYLPEDSLVHNLTDRQVSDMYTDLVAGCEEAYEDASEKAEEAIERVYMQGEGEYRGIDPYDLPTSEEEPFNEKPFCATEVVQEALSGVKSSGRVVSENKGFIRHIYR